MFENLSQKLDKAFKVLKVFKAFYIPRFLVFLIVFILEINQIFLYNNYLYQYLNAK